MGSITAQLSQNFYSDLVHIFWQSPYYRGDKTNFDFDTVAAAMDSFLNDDVEYEDVVNNEDWVTSNTTNITGSAEGMGSYADGSITGTSSGWMSSSDTRNYDQTVSPGDGNFSNTSEGTETATGKVAGIKGSWKQNRQWKRDKVAWFFKYAQFCATMANNKTLSDFIEEFGTQYTEQNSNFTTQMDKLNSRLNQHTQDISARLDTHNTQFNGYVDDYNRQMKRSTDSFDDYKGDFNYEMQAMTAEHAKLNSLAGDEELGIFVNPNEGRFLEEYRYQMNRHNTHFEQRNDDYNTRMQTQYEQQLRFNNMASDKDQGVYFNPNLKDDRYKGNFATSQAAFDVSMEDSEKVEKVKDRMRNPINWDT